MKIIVFTCFCSNWVCSNWVVGNIMENCSCAGAVDTPLPTWPDGFWVLQWDICVSVILSPASTQFPFQTNKQGQREVGNQLPFDLAACLFIALSLSVSSSSSGSPFGLLLTQRYWPWHRPWRPRWSWSWCSRCSFKVVHNTIKNSNFVIVGMKNFTFHLGCHHLPLQPPQHRHYHHHRHHQQQQPG